MTTYGPRSHITYRNFLGEDVDVLVKEQVTTNGKPGFIGFPKGEAEGQAVWGYDDQITCVVRP